MQNENSNETSPHTYQNFITKRSVIRNIADDMEKRESFALLVGMYIGAVTLKTVWHFLKS